jgi:hypothetical protein
MMLRDSTHSDLSLPRWEGGISITVCAGEGILPQKKSKKQATAATDLAQALMGTNPGAFSGHRTCSVQ